MTTTAAELNAVSDAQVYFGRQLNNANRKYQERQAAFVENAKMNPSQAIESARSTIEAQAIFEFWTAIDGVFQGAMRNHETTDIPAKAITALNAAIEFIQTNAEFLPGEMRGRCTCQLTNAVQTEKAYTKLTETQRVVSDLRNFILDIEKATA